MMKNRYDKYKDSGIAWIGEIPEHWEVKRLKYFGNNYNGLTYSPNDICSSQEGIIVLRSSNIKDNKLCFDDNVYVNKEISTKLLVNKGDILICSRNGSASLIGKAALIETDIKATFGAFMMIFKGNNICHKYLYYIVTSCISQYKWLFTTATINQLTSSMLGEIFAPFICNKLEQQSIAAYLDQKCGEIDELITLQEEMITKLQSYKQSVITEAVTKGLDKNVPLKDSGIEWIGEIPEHWNVVKIKYLAKIKSGDSISSNEIIQEGIYEVYGGNGLMGYCNEKNVDGFNIIIGRVGALCGNVRLISESKYITDNALILNCFNNSLYPYMYIMLKAANLNNLNTSNAQPLITGSKVLNVSLPIPPLHEQQMIATYLDQRCSEIDELISIKQQKIEKLKEYKKSLIFECVTGKRKVS